MKNTFGLMLLAFVFTSTLSAQNQTFQYANASVLTNSNQVATKGNLAVDFKETGIGNAKITFYKLGWTNANFTWGCAKNGKLNNGAPHQFSSGSGSTTTQKAPRNGSVTFTIYSDLALTTPEGFSCPSAFTPVLYKAEYNGVTLAQIDESGNTLATANVNCGASSGATGCTVSGNVSY